MKIGIVIAVAEELNTFFSGNFETKSFDIGTRKVYTAKINNNQIYITQSGYGKIDASSATEFLITKYDCKLILNYGVTGAIVKGLNVEDLFVVRKTINYDFDISQIEPVKKNQYLCFEDEYIPLDNKMIDLVKSVYPEIKEAVVASGDRFIEKLEDKKYLANELKCNICDMEIAGIAKTASFNNIPCLSIKCISDTLEGSGKDFHENVSKSAKLAFNLIEKLLKEYI